MKKWSRDFKALQRMWDLLGKGQNSDIATHTHTQNPWQGSMSALGVGYLLLCSQSYLIVVAVGDTETKSLVALFSHQRSAATRTLYTTGQRRSEPLPSRSNGNCGYQFPPDYWGDTVFHKCDIDGFLVKLCLSWGEGLATDSWSRMDHPLGWESPDHLTMPHCFCPPPAGTSGTLLRACPNNSLVTKEKEDKYAHAFIKNSTPKWQVLLSVPGKQSLHLLYLGVQSIRGAKTKVSECLESITNL